ncbi:MAG TPA: SIMPL domain-containing protein [Candidatus Paceibacterota bacterium]|nr:SIMPL domain-containing protein [Candidatus Paceibacterota bacterium]
MNEYCKRFWENQFVPLGTLLGAALIVVGIIAASTAVSIKNASNVLSVTGSATKTVTADRAIWTIASTRSSFESGLPQTTAQVVADSAKVMDFFKNAGIAAESITIGAVHTDQDYSYSSDVNAPKRYQVRQDVKVASNDPSLIQKLAQNITALTNQGLVLFIQDPQYYVSSLPELRVSLMSDAIADAKARAEQIVKTTGQGVGRLQSASSGVVQVLAGNSTEVSDYGAYDTSTIDKTVMVTVRATFFVK